MRRCGKVRGCGAEGLGHRGAEGGALGEEHCDEIASKCSEIGGKSFLKLYGATDRGHLDPVFPDWEPARSLGRTLLKINEMGGEGDKVSRTVA